MSTTPHLIQMVVSQIQFFANLVFGRNYVCSKYFKDIFTFRSVMNYLQLDMNRDVRASLLQLLTVCYIDERPRFRETFPNLNYTFREVRSSTGHDSNRLDDHEK